jgi:RES domain
MKSPTQSKVERDRTHRLIPYRYSDSGRPILNLLAQDDDLLSDLTELEGATNDRLLGESGRLPGVSAIELVSGFRLAHIVNASFTHAHPLGRFNSAGRGAWYAAFDRAAELKEVGWKSEEVSPYIDYFADFRHEFHDIRGDPDFVDCLDPHSYIASQTLGLKLLTSGSAGIVYPSVLHKDGVCIACFRPPLVLNVQKGPRVTFTFMDTEMTAVIEN